jgi:hypothetical protein
MNTDNLKNLEKFKRDMLNEDFFNKFIEGCEQNIIAAPENFASSVMNKINAGRSVKAIPFISRKMRAAVCFTSAFAVMTLTFTGINSKIIDFLSAAVSLESLEKIGGFLDIFSKFNLQ